MSAPISPPRRRRRRRTLWVVVPLVVVIGVVAAVAIQSRRAQAHSKSSVSSDDLDLRLGKAEVSDIQVSVNEVGTIEPLVKVDVKSTLSGKVTELLVVEGTHVTQGQVLARVEPDVNQAQTLSAVKSEMNLAEIHAANARKDLETNQRLHDEGYLSDTEFKDFRF